MKIRDGHVGVAVGAEWTEAVEALGDTLTAEGVQYARMRGAVGGAEWDHGDIEILVAPTDAARLEAAAARHGLRLLRPDERSVPGEEPGLVLHTQVRYGGAKGWLSTGYPEHRMLARARTVFGMRQLSAADDLMDTLLHCILDLGSFSERHRRRLIRIMEELRQDPPEAGFAAERTQFELAPSITWDRVLADIMHERWSALLARRMHLRTHLFTRRPAAAMGRLARARGRAPVVRNSGSLVSETPNGAVGVDEPPQLDRSGTSVGADPSMPSGSTTIVAPASGEPRPPGADALNRKQIRGSGLFLFGRSLSTGIKFLADLLVVRHLATAAYGSWAWALSVLLLLEAFSTMGLNRAVARFVPVHLERKERDELLGVVAFVSGSILVMATLVVIAFFAFPQGIASLSGARPGQSLDVLFIIIFLLPIQALGNFFTVLSAALGDSRAIFFRRYLLHPGLRLVVALTLVSMQADVRMLAYGYLFSGIVGLGYYCVAVYGQLLKRGLLAGGFRGNVILPVRRVLTYTVPAMGADWFRTLMVTPAPLLLGYFTDMETVALYQVVIPLVALNTHVWQSFVMFYEPSASRVLARGDTKGLESLYWRSAAWVAVLTFPGFALTFTAAEPLTILLFGERYAAAAPILSLVAFGTFVDAAAGFNDSTLRVSGNVRWLVAVNSFSAVLNILLNVLLIPRMGAMGAGLATGTSMFVYAVLKKICLWRVTGVRMVPPAYLGSYLVMGSVVVGLVFLRIGWADDLRILVPCVLAGIVLVALQARATLSITETFPELARWPPLKRLLG